MTLLEDRLAAAGDQLDLLIETMLNERSVDDGRAVTSIRGRVFAAAACVALVLGAGLVWSTRGSEVAQPAIATSVREPEPTMVGTTAPPGSTDSADDVVVASTDGNLSLECWPADPTPVVVAAAQADDGSTIEYVVDDRATSFVEVIRVAGSQDTLMASCIPRTASQLFPAMPWAVAGTYSAGRNPSVAVRGRASAGSTLVTVTLGSGAVVDVVPSADGWFLVLLATSPADADQPPVVVSVVETPSTPVQSTATTVPVADRSPLAIGESVMLGAVPQLQAGGFVVNASESRLGEDTADVVGQLRAAGQIGEVVVLQVGTNGPVAEETYDRIMSFLPADEVPTVVFLTVHAPGRGWIEPNNQLVRSLPSRYPNVKVLDWAGLVESGQVPGLAGDGIHLGTDAAKQWYANHVFDFSGRRDLVQPLPTDG